MPRFPGFYDTGMPSKYHKSCRFCDLRYQEYRISQTPKNQPFKISISNQTRPGRKMTVSALSKPSGLRPQSPQGPVMSIPQIRLVRPSPIKALGAPSHQSNPYQSPHITPSSLPIPPHFCLTFADKLPAFDLRIDQKPCPVRVNIQLFIKPWPAEA